MVTLIAVGDMMFDRRLRPPRLFFHYPDVTTCVGPEGLNPTFHTQICLPFDFGEDELRWLAALERSIEGVKSTAHKFESITIPDAEDAGPEFPFAAMRLELSSADFVFGNLECPLTSSGRRMKNDGAYSADPAYARALHDAGFRVVSLANNHAFDYGETGLLETVSHLRESGVEVIGAGASLLESRAPALFEIDGLRIGLLAYTMVAPDFSFASGTESGVAPFNPFVTHQDLQHLKELSDYRIVSVHWGVEGRAHPSTRIVEFAHDLVNSGADLVLGHHSHVPGSIEVYRGKPILYSLGNFSFGHDHRYWSNDFVARISISSLTNVDVDIVPITGRFQPSVLHGEPALRLLRRLQEVSSFFNTRIELVGDRGRLIVPEQR